MNTDENDKNGSSDLEDKYFKIKAGIFLTSVTGMSILGGFGMTLAMAKKQDPAMFAKGIHGTREIPESGISLATRALARGSLYSVAGFSLFCFTVWKLMGVHNFVEFRQKVGSFLPTIPKSPNPGRSDFKTIRDLFNYIIEEDEKEKKAKKAT
ncbi:transmembrane protein 242-like [Physella acuta]|uniref:transmembrane protein 242-like n=1 Tax=Physella acuta TaxID=109671 RepID=UPI0027DAFC02|nr:transmembrane protein 242-like [Physella acuta]XP_059139369.1 transmembrane protein 242-like [Physella acuta]XP_059139370.1 transmembrane protein 242-like [Physella acuta]XP_059139371.1 transmembrane protein 242-like [Physella acuta]XP_059139372.1 transmembrane protein 242-like [Physella acuta]XP_059139373.1 transmembrane protein 242-like [Physella acuta]